MLKFLHKLFSKSGTEEVKPRHEYQCHCVSRREFDKINIGDVFGGSEGFGTVLEGFRDFTEDGGLCYIIVVKVYHG